MFYDVAKTCLEKPVAKAPKGSELIINYSLTLLRYPNQVRLTTVIWLGVEQNGLLPTK
jgi:hypothetical protein